MDHIDVWIDNKWEQWAKQSPHALIVSAPSTQHLRRLLSRGLEVNKASSTSLFSPPSFLLQNCGMDGVRALIEYGRDVNTLHHHISDIGWAIESKNLALCKTMMPHLDHQVSSTIYPQHYTPLEQSLLFFPGFAFELAKEGRADFLSSQRQEEMMADFLVNRAKSPHPKGYISHQIWQKWGSEQSLERALLKAKDEERAKCLDLVSFAPTKQVKKSTKPKRAFVEAFVPPSYLSGDNLQKYTLLHMIKTDQVSQALQFIEENNIDINASVNRGLPVAFDIITHHPKGVHALASLIDWHHENTNKDTIAMQYIRYLMGYSRGQLNKSEEQALRVMIKNTGINYQNSEGRTLLMTAVSSIRKVEDYILLDLLLSYKPDLFLTDRNGCDIQHYLKKTTPDFVNNDYFRSIHASFTKKLISEALMDKPEERVDQPTLRNKKRM